MQHGRRFLLSLVASAASVVPSYAIAQQSGSVVIMRKVLTSRPDRGAQNPTTPAPGAKGEWRTGDWTWSSAEYCSENAPQVRAVDCVSGGAIVADARCAPVPKPDTARTAPRTGGCYYVWKASAWSAPAPACGETTQTRTITCSRSDGTPAPESMCTTRKGETVQPSVDFSQCTHAWVVGSWDDWSSTCSPTASRARKVICQRSDGAPDADEKCEAISGKPETLEVANLTEGCAFHWDTTAWQGTGERNTCGPNPQSRIVRCVNVDGGGAEDSSCLLAKPDTQRIDYDDSGCSFAWHYGLWDDPAPACGATTQTRTAFCQRSDGTVAEPANCTEPLDASRVTSDYRACTYDWDVGAWSDWSSTCSKSAARTRSTDCVRSDGEPEKIVSHCPNPVPASEEHSAIFSGCTYSWSAGPWTKNVGCGQVPQTRTVTCVREDGEPAEADLCNAATRPSDTTTVGNYDACHYSYQPEDWTDWNSTCSQTAQRTRQIDCVREDGALADPKLCSGTLPVNTETSAIYTGCSYKWASRGYSDPQPSCGPVQIPEQFVCLRSDNQEVEDALCTTPKPTHVQTVEDYGACTFAWQTGEWQPWSSTCSATAKRTRTVECRRSDGSIVRNGCTATAPDGEETAAIYTGCSYDWAPQGWTSPPYCGNVVQNRDVPCKRSDGTVVSDSFCTAAKPATQQNGTDYSACTYAWTTSAWSGYDSSCSSAATRTRTVQCQRSDLTAADPKLCTGTMPAKSESTAIYTGCTYKWTTYPWESTYACSESDVQTRRVECTRVDDLSSVVADSFCSSQGTKPATTQTVSNTTQCSASLVNGGFENDVYGWNTTQPVSISTTVFHGGTKSLKMDTSGQARQYISTVKGKVYTLSYWAYTKNGLYMNSYGPQGKVIENKALSNSGYQWVFFSGTFTGTGAVVQLGFYHYAPNGGGTSWLDDVTVN